MKCKYCKKEDKEIINGRQDICGCEKSKIDWKLSLEIQHHKKILQELNKKLKDLEQDKGVIEK